MEMQTKRYHWIFDALGVPEKITWDKDRVEQALRDIAAMCEMTIMTGPHSFEGVPSNPGLTSLCGVDFSHITIHTFSFPYGTGEVCVDVFSCKPYDPVEIHQYLLKTFQVEANQADYYEVMPPPNRGT
ncbi:MAG: S-adenosylmethionine decarboxylase [Candidatus Spechtbacteria bacterium]|nr:S-adenosylmethionine decarboxylase [Candidatus Spechtbacteria bacterium]